MSQPLLIESPGKTNQLIEHHKPQSDPSSPSQSKPHPVLQLQRALGNRYVARLIQAKPLKPETKIAGLKPKLAASAVDDQYEREAENITRPVMSIADSAAMAFLQQTPQVEGEARQSHMPQSKHIPLSASITPSVQRQTGVTEEIEDQKDKEQEEDEEQLTWVKASSRPVGLIPEQRKQEEAEPVKAKSAESLRESFKAEPATSTEGINENIRAGGGRPAGASRATPLSVLPDLTIAAETQKAGESSQAVEPSAAPSARPAAPTTPEMTGKPLSGVGSEPKIEEAISPAPELSGPGDLGIKKQDSAESMGMEQITAAPDTPLKPHAIAEARLVNNDCLRSEERVAQGAATRRQQISEHFSSVRRELSDFLTKSMGGVRFLVIAKQTEIIAASAKVLESIRAVITNALQTAEAESSEAREEISGIIESITASIQERVGGIANQIVNVINAIPFPDLPGVAQIRSMAANLLSQAAGVVNGAIGQGMGFIRSAFDAGMNLLSSFFHTFTQLANQALALAASAILRMVQLIFQALNQLVHLIVSTLENVLSSAITPLLNQLEAALIQAVSGAEQQTLAQLRANKAQHLSALALAISPSAGGGVGRPAAKKAASMDDSIAAIRAIGQNAIQNDQLIIQSFEEQTSSIVVLIFQRLAAAAGQIMREISSRIAGAVGMIVSKVSQVIQSFMQLMQTVVTFIQALVQVWIGALARIVQYVRSLAQHPVDQLIDFAQKTLSRIKDFISRLIQNFISSGGSIVGNMADAIGVFKLTPSLLGPAPAFAGPPIQIIAGFIIILIAGVAYVFPLWVGIVIVVVVVLLLILLLYLLYRWLFKPRPVPPPPPPPPPPKGREYHPGSPFNVAYSVPLVKLDIEASAGEQMIFGVEASDEDRFRTIGTPGWTTFTGTGPYEILYEVSGEADLLSPGSGAKKHIDPKLTSRNIYLFISSSWSKKRITVTATLKDKSLPVTPPDIGTTKDPDHAITWTIIERKNPCPSGLKQVSGPGSVWVSAPAVYGYQGTPSLSPPGTPSYENQTVLESFKNTLALGFTMSDLKASWKAANPTLNTPDKVANYLYGASSNGTFVFDNDDRIYDKHGGFGDVSPFESAALARPTGVGYRKDQTYSCASTGIGSALIERRYTSSKGIEVRKTGP